MIRLDIRPIAREILRPQTTKNTMWPVMTLTLLHQLTDDEQLYAKVDGQEGAPTEVHAPAQEAPEQEVATAMWPAEGEADC